jgi:hypothetical protein
MKLRMQVRSADVQPCAMAWLNHTPPAGVCKLNGVSCTVVTPT